jgi:transposase
MAQPIAPDYGQQFLFPPALEDWVPADHPARFLREFVDQLDLAALGFALPTAVEGRPPYAVSVMLKIWLFGYFHRIRSTRKLEAACRENLGLLWLSGLIQPDHNSLWRFWRDNQVALRGLFKQSVQVAVRSGAVGLALQAVDGTKIEAAGSGHSGWTKEYMEKLLAQLDQSLEQAEVQILAENGAAGPNAGYRLPAGLAQRQALREQIVQGLGQLQADGREHYHPVEPEARRMKVGSSTRYAYNAQAVADAQEGVIVACEVSRQETDAGQLVPMMEAAQQNVGVAAQQTTTLADTGYGAGADLHAAEAQGWSVLVPPAEGKPAHDNPYAAQHFVYDALAQTVTCPRGQRLEYEGHTTKQGVPVQRYRCRCADCPVRGQCTQDRKGRQIEVWPHTPAVQAMRQRLQEPGPARQYGQRCQIIERVFGQVKQHDGFRRWTVWGLEKVRTQWALVCTTLNLRVLYQRWRSSGQTPTPIAAQASGWASCGPQHPWGPMKAAIGHSALGQLWFKGTRLISQQLVSWLCASRPGLFPSQPVLGKTF